MIIAIDDAIPYWHDAFSLCGELRALPGRSICPADVGDADALIVRSVTRVNRDLIEGSRIRFVGTATIGMDHLDEAYLRSRGTRYINAAGSNANAVAEYVTAALLTVAERRGWDLSRRSIAVIGVGHVGSRVEKKARALGMEVLLCDPPLREATGDEKYRSLPEVLGADVITLHVPLTADGPYPTQAMIDERILAGLSRDQYLINTARGPVVRGGPLKAALAASRLEGAVLDVWEGEPRIDYSLLDLVDLGSAHIAGYSLDGKVRATSMILEELCAYFGLRPSWDTSSIFPPAKLLRPARGSRGQNALRSVVQQAYNIRMDDRDLRSLSSLGEEEARAGFDRLRNEYDLRLEFNHHLVELEADQANLDPILRQLGFQTRPAEGSAPPA